MTDLENQSLKIDGEYLSHLRFADDILVCSNTLYELQQKLQGVADEHESQGLKVNKSRTDAFKQAVVRSVLKRLRLMEMLNAATV